MDPATAYSHTLDVLKGLQDVGYSYVTGGDPEHDHVLFDEPHAGDDLRHFNITQPKPFKFLFQGRHDAPKYKGPNGDILNFAIYESGSGSVLRMFSISRIHGALGDHGQNYKTLHFLSDKLTSKEPTPVYGCGLPIASAAPPSTQRASESLRSLPFHSSGLRQAGMAELDFSHYPQTVYHHALDVLKSLKDHGYSYITGGDPNPGDDLRHYNIEKPKNFQFIFQGRHDSPKYSGPNADILDFTIYKKGSGSVLRMFSISRIHGALGDAGQNYKTLAFMADMMGASKKPVPKYGCGLTL
ncbi:unnamed protein product [Symbiodinium sp. CCMP2592]|nr:unnamed protein product [Symbiodinium sp. CCMP2592]